MQKGLEKQQIFRENWDMQIYNSKQLRETLEKNGFKNIKFYDFYLGKSSTNKSPSLLTVAEKK